MVSQPTNGIIRPNLPHVIPPLGSPDFAATAVVILIFYYKSIPEYQLLALVHSISMYFRIRNLTWQSLVTPLLTTSYSGLNIWLGLLRTEFRKARSTFQQKIIQK